MLASDPLSVAVITSQVAADSCVDGAVVVQSTVQSVRRGTTLGRNRYGVVAFARNNIRVNGKILSVTKRGKIYDVVNLLLARISDTQ